MRFPAFRKKPSGHHLLAAAVFALALLPAFQLSATEFAGDSSDTTPVTEPIFSVATEVNLSETDRLPGVDLAEGITAVTGVAISPLLGVSVIGAWKYFRTPPRHRETLPWFCHPAAWGFGLSLLALCAFKDVIGTGAPPLIKKPLDVAELFENKASAALAAVAFVPFVANQISTHFLAETASGATAATAVGDGAALLALAPNQLIAAGISPAWFLAPLLGVAFLAVWVMCHSINVLLLLSPFGLIDAGLKTLRLGLLAVVVTLSAVSPTLAAIFCVILIVVAIILAPWAFRLAVFGSVMAGDLAASVVYRSPGPAGRVFGFLGHTEKNGFKARCGGWVSRDSEGNLKLTSRRLFVGPSRSLKIGNAKETVLRKGLFFPRLSTLDGEGKVGRPTLLLLPRYRHHIDSLASLLEVGEVRENLLKRGIHGMVSWLKDALEIGRYPEGRLTDSGAPETAGALPSGSDRPPEQS